MEKESIGFTLLGIKTEQFALFPENYALKKEVNLNTSLEFKISKEKRQIGVYATYTFDQSKKSFVKIQVSCHFEIKSDAWSSFLNENKITFPKAFIGHLTMISVGTARGILHSKTEGTEFNKYVLPTINVNELVDKDAEFELM